MSFNIHPADGTPLVLTKPLVDALHMEEVHARQPPHVLLCLELGQADGALVSLLLLLSLTSSPSGLPLGELVRESVSLDARPCGSSRHTSPCATSFCVQPHVFLRYKIDRIMTLVVNVVLTSSPTILRWLCGKRKLIMPP